MCKFYAPVSTVYSTRSLLFSTQTQSESAENFRDDKNNKKFYHKERAACVCEILVLTNTSATAKNGSEKFSFFPQFAPQKRLALQCAGKFMLTAFIALSSKLGAHQTDSILRPGIALFFKNLHVPLFFLIFNLKQHSFVKHIVSPEYSF